MYFIGKFVGPSIEEYVEYHKLKNPLFWKSDLCVNLLRSTWSNVSLGKVCFFSMHL
jgi:hypothetical protein